MEGSSVWSLVRIVLEEGKWFFIIPGLVLLYEVVNICFLGVEFRTLHVSVILICLFIIGYTAFFLRPPLGRSVSPDEKKIYASADGSILSIEYDVQCPYIPEGRYHKVIIFMHVANMHWNLSPIRGTIIKSLFSPGKFGSAFKAERNWRDNEHHIAIIKNKESQDTIMVGMIAGLIARRIRFLKKKDDPLNQGSILGLIRYGSANVLYFPSTYKIKVSLKQKSRAGQTVIAEKE